MRISLLLFFLVSFFAQASQAQSLTAKIDAKEVLVRNTFEVKYEFAGSMNNSFRPPNFDGLKIISGPFRGSETKIINGKVSKKTSYSYTLAGLNPGTFTIRPASVTVKGKKIFSKSLTVKILQKGSPRATNSLEDVFLETVVLDTPAYPGSQININYVLHTSINLAGMSLRKEDEYQEFIVRKLSADDNGKYEVINGKQYLSQVIKRVALYPTQAGLVKVNPLSINIEIPEEVQPRNTSLFDQFFSSNRYKNKILASDPVEIRTNNFPHPIPNNFSGASGRLEMESRLSDQKISTDDAVSLKVQLTGTSNPTEIKAPLLDLPDDLSIFPAKVIQDTIRERDGKLAFSKTFEYLIQPQKQGKFNFQVKTSYFDLVSQSFKEIKSPMLNLVVTKGSMATEVDDEDESESSVNFMPFVWGILGLLVFLFGIFVWKRSTKNILPNEMAQPITKPIEEKNIDSQPIVTETPIQATKTTVKTTGAFHIATNLTGKPYLQEVLNETELYFQAKLNIPYAQFNKEQVFQKLQEVENSTTDVSQLKHWWTKLEASIYANMPLPDGEAGILNEIKELVGRLKY